MPHSSAELACYLDGVIWRSLDDFL